MQNISRQNKKPKQPDFFGIIKNAGKLVWRRKYFWCLGFLVVLSDFFSASWNVFDSESGLFETGLIDSYAKTFHWWGPIFVAMFFLNLVFLCLKIVASGAIIHSASQEAKGENSNFKEGINIGKKYFWQLLLISLLLGMLIFVAIFSLFFPVVILLTGKNILAGTVMGIAAFFIILVVIILAAYLRIFGFLYVVLGKLPFWPALEAACLLLRKNLASSVLMGVFLLILSVVMGTVLLIIALPILAVFGGLAFIGSLFFGGMGAVVVAILVVLISLVIFIWVSSFYQAFLQTVWVLFFRQIALLEESPAVPAEVVSAAKEETLPAMNSQQTDENF